MLVALFIHSGYVSQLRRSDHYILSCVYFLWSLGGTWGPNTLNQTDYLFSLRLSQWVRINHQYIYVHCNIVFQYREYVISLIMIWLLPIAVLHLQTSQAATTWSRFQSNWSLQRSLKMVRHPLKIGCPALKSIAGYGLLYTLMLGLSLTYRPPIMMHHYRTRLRISFPHSITTCLHFDNPLIENNHRHSHSPMLLVTIIARVAILCVPLTQKTSLFSSASRRPSPSEVERERHKWNLASCTTHSILCDCPRPRFSSSSKFRCDVNVQVRPLACLRCMIAAQGVRFRLYYAQINFIHLFYGHWDSDLDSDRLMVWDEWEWDERRMGKGG